MDSDTRCPDLLNNGQGGDTSAVMSQHFSLSQFKFIAQIKLRFDWSSDKLTCGYELCCVISLINDNIFVRLSTLFLFVCHLSLSLLSFLILCETVYLSSRPQALGESPTSFSIPSVNISSTYNQLHIWEITWFLKLYDSTNPRHGSQRKNNIQRTAALCSNPNLMAQQSVMWRLFPVTTAFFIQRRNVGIFCGVEGCCILSAAMQTLKEGGGEREKMCKAGWEERLHPPSLANGLLSKSVSQLEG